ncbi:hypothetical protein DL96DRAFT_1685842 [Flagelloscypha sp. PMI_526]|nr:hypothetical protein DL96DRAFT_1685842 [Flagelloscypha sp. PMI_526]
MAHASYPHPNDFLNQSSGSVMRQIRGYESSPPTSSTAPRQSYHPAFNVQPTPHRGILRAEIGWRQGPVATQDGYPIQSSWNTEFVERYPEYVRHTDLSPSAQGFGVVPGFVEDAFEEVDSQAPMPRTPVIPYRALPPDPLSPIMSPLPLNNFQSSTLSATTSSASQRISYTGRIHQILCVGSRLQGVNILTDDLSKHVPNEVLRTLATTPPVCEVRIILRKDWGMGTVKNSRGVTVGDVLRGLSDYLRAPLPWNSIVTRDMERAAGWREGVTGSHQDSVRGVDLLERRVHFGGFADYGEQHGWVLGLISSALAYA